MHEALDPTSHRACSPGITLRFWEPWECPPVVCGEKTPRNDKQYPGEFPPGRNSVIHI